MAAPVKTIRLLMHENNFHAMFSPITRCQAGGFLWSVDIDPPIYLSTGSLADEV